MQTDIEQSIQAYIGSICEVLTPNNDLLLVGTLRRFSPLNNEIFIELFSGAVPPRSQNYKEPVKIQLHRAKNKEKVQVFFGVVIGCSKNDWRVQLQDAVVLPETRQNFRQRAHCNIEVARVWTESYKSATHPCKLIDISLGGLCFRSDFKYILREHLFISSIQLRPGGATYQFNCIVRRVQQDQTNPDECIYGCEFAQLTPQEENALCQDIFALQADELNRFKK